MPEDAAKDKETLQRELNIMKAEVKALTKDKERLERDLDSAKNKLKEYPSRRTSSSAIKVRVIWVGKLKWAGT